MRVRLVCGSPRLSRTPSSDSGSSEPSIELAETIDARRSPSPSDACDVIDTIESRRESVEMDRLRTGGGEAAAVAARESTRLMSAAAALLSPAACSSRAAVSS
eukprot:COSAG04_NODE_7664_length_1090_cov_1.026236_2_plen_102_part_01